jgi:tRNA(Ile2) C34 agmatinyltransferase TiaS
MTDRSVLDGGATLEGLLSTSLAEAQANGSSECPVCHARMTSTGAGAAAECGGCGSRLS